MRCAVVRGVNLLTSCDYRGSASTITLLRRGMSRWKSRDIDRRERGVYDSLFYLLSPKGSRVTLRRSNFKTSSTMNNFNFSDCRKAVNQAAFRPTKSRKALALQLLSEAVDFINNLEEVADKPSKKAKSKKRRRKTTKRTPSQKVADRQEMANKTNEVGPIKPSKKAKTASVKEARESAKAVSEATGAAQRAAKKAELRKEAETADKVASLEAKIEALTAVLAVHMESTTLPSPSNEVGLDGLPF